MSTIFRTEIVHHSLTGGIEPNSRILMLGSCFTQSIGSLFEKAKFDIATNPFGITYNPLSIALSIHKLLSTEQIVDDDLIFNQGKYISFQHHGSFSNSIIEQALSNMNSSLQDTRQRLSNLDYLFITLGTYSYFEHKETKTIVNNCHKLPASLFEHKQATVEEITDALGFACEKLLDLNPACTIVFSISPIRYLSNGAHVNSLNKSTLFLAVDQLMKKISRSYYFPAYEIMMDDLRDYRFYKEDMLHPTDTAIKYIWEQVQKLMMEPQTLLYLKRIDKINAQLAHKPMNENSAAHLQFKRQLSLEIDKFKEEYPNARFD